MIDNKKHPPVVYRLLNMLTKHKVDFTQQDEYDPSTEHREEVVSIHDANVISTTKNYTRGIVLDIDIPAALIQSSTSEHNHLYIELPHTISWDLYVEFLDVAAKIGLLQEGYVDASKGRGYTSVRLPWIHKGDLIPNEDNLVPPF